MSMSASRLHCSHHGTPPCSMYLCHPQLHFSTVPQSQRWNSELPRMPGPLSPYHPVPAQCWQRITVSPVVVLWSLIWGQSHTQAGLCQQVFLIFFRGLSEPRILAWPRSRDLPPGNLFFSQTVWSHFGCASGKFVSNRRCLRTSSPYIDPHNTTGLSNGAPTTFSIT